jgi:hypothetical protein
VLIWPLAALMIIGWPRLPIVTAVAGVAVPAMLRVPVLVSVVLRLDRSGCGSDQGDRRYCTKKALHCSILLTVREIHVWASPLFHERFTTTRS